MAYSEKPHALNDLIDFSLQNYFQFFAYYPHVATVIENAIKSEHFAQCSFEYSKDLNKIDHPSATIYADQENEVLIKKIHLKGLFKMKSHNLRYDIFHLKENRMISYNGSEDGTTTITVNALSVEQKREATQKLDLL